MTSSEAGYYLHFRFNNQTGLPYGCQILNDTFEGLNPADPKDQMYLTKLGKIGMSNCDKQEAIKDEITNEPIWKTVVDFAKKENLALWHTEFLDAYKTMASNLNSNLRTQSFPMAHGCQCMQTFVDIWGSGSFPYRVDKYEKIAKSAMECYNLCKNHGDCKEFLYNEENHSCRLYKMLIYGKKVIKQASRFNVHGIVDNCTEEQLNNSCQFFE